MTHDVLPNRPKAGDWMEVVGGCASEYGATFVRINGYQRRPRPMRKGRSLRMAIKSACLELRDGHVHLVRWRAYGGASESGIEAASESETRRIAASRRERERDAAETRELTPVGGGA